MSPRTRSLKGLYLEAATIRNRIKNDLFPESLNEDLRRAVTILEYPTWILLIHITDDEYRAELSKPEGIENNQVTGWIDRIFIPDTDDQFGERAAIPGGVDSGQDIYVPVHPKPEHVQSIATYDSSPARWANEKGVGESYRRRPSRRVRF